LPDETTAGSPQGLCDAAAKARLLLRAKRETPTMARQTG